MKIEGRTWRFSGSTSILTMAASESPKLESFYGPPSSFMRSGIQVLAEEFEISCGRANRGFDWKQRMQDDTAKKFFLRAETRLLSERVSHRSSRAAEIKILPFLAKYENELHEFMNCIWR